MIIIFRKDRPQGDPEIRVMPHVREAHVAFGNLVWWRKDRPDVEGFGLPLEFLSKRWTHISVIGQEVTSKKGDLKVVEILRHGRVVV